LTKQQLRNNLKEEPRFTALLTPNTSNVSSALAYLLPGLSEAKRKAV
jgi:type II secretory pathway pseudopilin PulG